VPPRIHSARSQRLSALVLAIIGTLAPAAWSYAQGGGVLRGRVFDATGAVVSGAVISVREPATGLERAVLTDVEGRYYVGGLTPGTYTVLAHSAGFRTETVEHLQVGVGRTVAQDFRLSIGPQSETVRVHAEVSLLDRGSSTVGHVVTAPAIQRMPLNGRHVMELALLVPGSVAPSQAGFSARPIRGVGALSLNTGGNREEAVAFLVNGVSSNNLTFGSFVFEPPLGSVQEFEVDNSALSAEHGHVSGAVINLVTRSGTDQVRGDLFEYFRNDALDARNFFEFTSREPHPFERNQFGGSLGGPLSPGRTFFFATFEALRQRQGIDMNTAVLSDAQRAAATNAVVQQLIPLIPRANYFDEDGTPRFIGSAPATVSTTRWTVDVTHGGPNDRLHAYFGRQQTSTLEPAGLGNSIPGFGLLQKPVSSLLTVSSTRVVGPTLLNEIRFGRSRLRGGTFPNRALNPAAFGIGNGVTRPIGLPQMIVAGAFNFGGPGTLPQGRFDTSYIFADTVTRVRGRHAVRFGGEYRHFINENVAEGTGIFHFPTVEAFLDGTANAFSITLGERRSVIDQRAVSFFAQDHLALHDRLTLELGVRYEWHVTPTERGNRLVVFDAAGASLMRVGVDVDAIHAQNNRNIEPRVGAAWDIAGNGRTIVRAAYTGAVDQPGTTAVRDTAGNPPFGVPLTGAGAIPLASALTTTRPAGLAPVTVDPAFRNASTRSWTVNVQRQVGGEMAVSAGYQGSRGSNLRITRNINQPTSGVRPFVAVSEDSPILPGEPLGNIMQIESSGFSRYHGAWVSITKRPSRGLQFDGSYTWSTSRDTNSLNSAGFAVQDSYDIRAQYGPSDFDARHRVVVRATYVVPFDRHPLARGWQVSVITQSQSGNPVNIVTPSSSVNGLANTVRPDLVGPIRIVGSVAEWFDRSVFVAVDRFGNLGRNAVIGPAFHNTDVSLAKTHDLTARLAVEFRVDVFNVFNHPNFGSPGNIVGTPAFGRITATRLPTGEAGSSRQVQLGARLTF
jgi:hypothetical protein